MRVRLLLVVVLFALIAAGVAIATTPGGKPVTVTVISERPDGAFPIVARVGDQFKITLDANHTTGFQWQLATKPNQKVTKKVSNVYNAPAESVPGRGGSETWTFKATGKGKTAIMLSYDQPWEKGTKGERIQKFEVEIRWLPVGLPHQRAALPASNALRLSSRNFGLTSAVMASRQIESSMSRWFESAPIITTLTTRTFPSSRAMLSEGISSRLLNVELRRWSRSAGHSA